MMSNNTAHNTISKEAVTGIILAGGAGSRMGGVDKGWVTFNNKPLISHVLAQLTPQVNRIMISANRELQRYKAFDWPVINDDPLNTNIEFNGPIAGILATLKKIKTPYAVIVPVDAPLLSQELVKTLINQHENNSKLVLINDGQRTHPLFGLYHVSLHKSLSDYYQQGNRRLMQWCLEQSPQIIKATHLAPSFTNINNHENLQSLIQ